MYRIIKVLFVATTINQSDYSTALLSKLILESSNAETIHVFVIVAATGVVVVADVWRSLARLIVAPKTTIAGSLIDQVRACGMSPIRINLLRAVLFNEPRTTTTTTTLYSSEKQLNLGQRALLVAVSVSNWLVWFDYSLEINNSYCNCECKSSRQLNREKTYAAVREARQCWPSTWIKHAGDGPEPICRHDYILLTDNRRLSSQFDLIWFDSVPFSVSVLLACLL